MGSLSDYAACQFDARFGNPPGSAAGGNCAVEEKLLSWLMVCSHQFLTLLLAGHHLAQRCMIGDLLHNGTLSPVLLPSLLSCLVPLSLHLWGAAAPLSTM